MFCISSLLCCQCLPTLKLTHCCGTLLNMNCLSLAHFLLQKLEMFLYVTVFRFSGSNNVAKVCVFLSKHICCCTPFNTGCRRSCLQGQRQRRRLLQIFRGRGHVGRMQYYALPSGVFIDYMQVCTEYVSSFQMYVECCSVRVVVQDIIFVGHACESVGIMCACVLACECVCDII